MTKSKKTLALILCMVMCLSMLPTWALAESEAQAEPEEQAVLAEAAEEPVTEEAAEEFSENQETTEEAAGETDEPEIPADEEEQSSNGAEDAGTEVFDVPESLAEEEGQSSNDAEDAETEVFDMPEAPADEEEQSSDSTEDTETEASEEADAPMDGETVEATDTAGSTEPPVPVVFTVTPEDATVTVYTRDNPDDPEEKTEIEAEEDGSYLLVPGVYFYDISANNYNSLHSQQFTVDSLQPSYEIDVAMIPLETEEPTIELAAASIADSGTCGKNLSWSLDPLGTLVVSGYGEMESFVSNERDDSWFNDNSTFYNRRGNVKEIIIESGVTSIADDAFHECKELHTVTISSTVSSIGSYAFNNCHKLSKINLSEGLVQIGDGAFYNCRSLERINLPVTLMRIGSGAFRSSGLFSITIPPLVTSLSISLFEECHNLDEVVLPDGLAEIGIGAFDYCSSLQHITIPNTVTSIGEMAFYGCTALSYLEIPAGVSAIKRYTFTNSGLRTIKLSEGVKSIEYQAFCPCEMLESIVMPKSMESIHGSSFWECTSLTDVYYAGNESDWKRISIGNDDTCLASAVIHYNSSGEEITAERVPTIYNKGDSSVILNEEIEECVAQTASSVYNSELAYYLCGLARAAYSETYLKKSLQTMGFAKENIKWHAENVGYVEEDLFADFMLAKKELEDGSLFVMVIVRGTAATREWVTDATLGPGSLIGINGSVHAGFRLCTKVVKDTLEEFLGDSAKYNTTFVITGHSLGAAVANLVSVSLMGDGVSQGRVYDYNFACPDVATASDDAWNPGGRYDNIFNIGDAADPVTIVPGGVMSVIPAVMGTHWGKYGLSRWFSWDWSHLNHLNFGNHDCGNYKEFLSGQPSFNSFKTWKQSRNASLVKRKILSIFCPVDVTVYDQYDNCIASVTGGAANYYNSSYGDVIILISEDQKIIVLPENGEYSVRLTGTDTGEMLYSVVDADLCSAEILQEKRFDNVQLANGKMFSSDVGNDIDVPDVNLYVTDSNGAETYKVLEDGSEEKKIFFSDVADPSAYYYVPVYWAVDQGITTGRSDTTFDPYGECTRGHIVTFLWRAFGKPEPTTSESDNPFDDVKSSDGFYKAVLWAYENGITTGQTATTFGPWKSCTRGQIVTFLWRAFGKPEPTTSESDNPFNDVKSSDGFCNAVLWAVENGITTGRNPTTFDPWATCTRGQAVTFLYRAMN